MAALERAMCGHAPPEVQRTVKALFGDQSGRQAVGRASDADGDSTAAAVRPGQFRTREFWAGPARANWAAVAAALAMVAGAILFGILGPRIGTRVAEPGATSVADVAAVVVSTHERCSIYDSCGMQRAPWRSTEDASRELSRLLVRSVEVPDLAAAGFEFCCGGQIAIPGAGDRSGHLLYCRNEPDGCSWLSVFVTPVETQFLASDAFGRTGPLDCAIQYYRFLAPGAGDLFYWCDGEVTWFVKTTDPSDFEIVRHFFPGALH